MRVGFIGAGLMGLLMVDRFLSERRRHFHRGLVGFEGDQRLFRLDRVAGLDHDLNDRHVLEVADVRNPDLGDTGRCAGRRRRRGDGGFRRFARRRRRRRARA